MSLPTLFAGKSAPGLSAALDLRFALDKSLTASKGPTPSFSRASTGTYFNSSGVLTSAAINAPRFNHTYNGTSWVSRGLLVEEQRTNLLINSNTFSSSWTLVRGTIAQDQTGPDGTTSGWTATCNSTGAGHYVYITPSSGASASGAYTISIFAKKGNNGLIALQMADTSSSNYVLGFFDLTNGVANTAYQVVGSYSATSSRIENIGNGWYRCSLTSTKGSSNVITAACYASNNDTTGFCTSGQYNYLYNAQLEFGAFATSTIVTTSAQVTRSADVCQITGTDFSGFWNTTEGSVVAEYDRSAVMTSSYSGGYPHVMEAHDGSTNNRFVIYGDYAGSGLENWLDIQGGSLQFLLTSPAVGANTTAKLAGCYKVNDSALSFNGAAVTTDTSCTIPTVTRMTIGYTENYAGGRPLNGHIARLRYFNKRLPNATLQLLSDPDPTLNLQFALNKSLTPVAGPAPSFSRASTGTFFNASGVLTSASINTPRFDHVYSGGQWVSRGLLVEEQRTNSLLQSNGFGTSPWSIAASRGTVTQNATSPDGATNAWTGECTATTANGFYLQQTGISSPSGTYTFSMFAKKGNNGFCATQAYDSSGSYALVYFNLNTGSSGNLTSSGYTSISHGMVDCGNGWYRCYLTFTKGNSNTQEIYPNLTTNGMGIYGCTSGQTNLFYGMQLESGSFPTSYIGTTTSSVTRSADVCQITGTSFNWMWNQGEGSALIEFDLIGRNESSGSYAMAWQADDNTLNNRLVQIAYEYSGTPSNAAGIYVATGGTGQANMYGTAIGVNILGRSAFAWKTNDFALSVNGGAVATDTSGSIPPTNQINFGRRISDGYLNGHISKLIYYPARLLDAKLQKLST